MSGEKTAQPAAPEVYRFRGEDYALRFSADGPYVDTYPSRAKPTRLRTPDVLAQVLGVDPIVVLRWINAGRIEFVEVDDLLFVPMTDAKDRDPVLMPKGTFPARTHHRRETEAESGSGATV